MTVSTIIAELSTSNNHVNEPFRYAYTLQILFNYHEVGITALYTVVV